MAFPSFTRKALQPLSPDGEKGSNVVRVESEGGYVMTRKRATKMPRVWGVVHIETDPTIITSVRTWADSSESTSFSWTHPDGTAYTVRTLGTVSIVQEHNNFWRVSFKLEEVL